MAASARRLGDGTNDVLSLHGGCPPADGAEKWAINGFMWNVPWTKGMAHF